MDLISLESMLIQHCYEMSIFKKDANQKKIDSILDSLVAAIIRSNTSFEDVVLCLKDVKDDKVIDMNLFKNGGNINDYVNPKWLKFAKALWRQRSAGLGTPNAASGEGELMLIFLSKQIKKPTKGDLLIDNEIIEIKGEDIRVTGNITGKNFKDKTLAICEKFGLTPNISNRTKKFAVELEKQAHQNHWIKELNKLSEENRISFVCEYLKCIDDKEINPNELFNNGVINFEELKKTIAKLLYNSMIKQKSFDKFIILGDGSNIKILSNNFQDFSDKIDDGTIKIGSDYFRINQDTNIGWYIY